MSGPPPQQPIESGQHPVLYQGPGLPLIPMIPHQRIPAVIGGVTIPPELRLEHRPEERPGGRYVVNTKYSPTHQNTNPNQTMQAPTGMYTRNLIGSLAASAARLTDPEDRIGIWFVLQDLSVRTEGEFRY